MSRNGENYLAALLLLMLTSYSATSRAGSEAESGRGSASAGSKVKPAVSRLAPVAVRQPALQRSQPAANPGCQRTALPALVKRMEAEMKAEMTAADDTSTSRRFGRSLRSSGPGVFTEVAKSEEPKDPPRQGKTTRQGNFEPTPPKPPGQGSPVEKATAR